MKNYSQKVPLGKDSSKLASKEKKDWHPPQIAFLNVDQTKSGGDLAKFETDKSTAAS